MSGRSPILFNIVVDMLAILIGRAKENGQVGGLVPHLVDGGVSILQYADDTIIFMEHDLAKARNMKLVLCLFEQLTGFLPETHFLLKPILDALPFSVCQLTMVNGYT